MIEYQILSFLSTLVFSMVLINDVQVPCLTGRSHLGIWPTERNLDRRSVSGRKTDTEKGLLHPVSRYHDNWEIR